MRALLLLWLPLAAPAAPVDVRLVVLGPVPEALVGAVRAGLERALPVRVTGTERRALPDIAWYPPRKRYRADRLLGWLARTQAGAPDGARVLGITAADISTTKGAHRDWGVFGLADLGGPAAVISTRRLKRGARDAAHLRFRVVSTAVHEVGHTLGLPHCAEPRCVMQDAEGSIANTDSGTGRPGPTCAATLAEVVRRKPR